LLRDLDVFAFEIGGTVRFVISGGCAIMCLSHPIAPPDACYPHFVGDPLEVVMDSRKVACQGGIWALHTDFYEIRGHPKK
jgi:hypothetical protein